MLRNTDILLRIICVHEYLDLSGTHCMEQHLKNQLFFPADPAVPILQNFRSVWGPCRQLVNVGAHPKTL